MPNPKAIPLSDALAEVTGGTPSLENAFAEAVGTSPAPASKASVLTAAAARSAPVITRTVEEVATNPSVPKAGSVVGQIVGGIQGAVRSPLDAAGGAWAGGKAGWFTGKLAQKLAAPVATALEAIAPFVEPLGYAPALQGKINVPGLSDIPVRDFLKLPKSEQDQRLQAAGFAPPHASWLALKLRTLLQ